MTNSGLRLAAGKVLEAWRRYPEMRRSLARIPPGPPIFVTGTHRSGTTWVAAMLAGRGVWYVHEPFSATKGLWQENFSYVRPEAEDSRIDRIVGEILVGGHRGMLNLPWADHPLMPLRLFRNIPRRILLKDPLACLMSAYLTRRFGMSTLVLFRHPAGFVSSLQRLGWPRAEPIRGFLANEALMRDWLEPYRDLMERYSERDGLESATVLCGCLNRVLWGYVARYPEMRGVLFEDLCLEPLERFRALMHDLGLPYGPETELRHRELCFDSSKKAGEYRNHEVKRDSGQMAERWRLELAPDEQKTVRRIWEASGIPLFVESRYW